ncbi:MAG: hypothetical protein SVU88_04015 [Candidatus Nanohaloarchaea archaeon]|nr:hypothetical protein [Candidatus Nanohaloarchaea archaeon]
MKRPVALFVLVLLLAGGGAAQDRMNVTVDQVRVGLGEQRTASLLLHNPLDEPDIYDIGVGTVMSEGAASVRIAGDDRTSDRVTVEVGAGERRTVQVTFSGAACSVETCTGTATFVGRSLETGERFTASTQVTVERDTEVYGSPGITALQTVVIGLVAAVASILVS